MIKVRCLLILTDISRRAYDALMAGAASQISYLFGSMIYYNLNRIRNCTNENKILHNLILHLLHLNTLLS